MKRRPPLFTLALAACVAGSLGACGSSDPAAPSLTLEVSDSTGLDTGVSVDSLPLQDPSSTEKDSLAFMREEEKLAHDVYAALARTWGGATPTFGNIAASETTHTEAVRQLLERYGLPDPAAGRAEGDFADPALQTLFARLTTGGMRSLVDALTVGVEIEELDIRDIQAAIDVIDNPDIILVYQNLMKGSRNHLRAFHRALVTAGGSYTPRFISQEAFDAILTGEFERG